jgi:hypothetical protein
MSAFIVDKKLITGVVRFYATAVGTALSIDQLAIARCLMRENTRSVNYRYRKTTRAPRITAMDVLKERAR